MAKSAAYEEKFRKYLGTRVSFKLDQKSQNVNPEALKKLTEALDHVGIDLRTNNNSLEIEIDSDKYLKACTRYAGPKEKKRRFETNNVGLKGDVAQYSDIITMMQTMTDKEIMTELNMPYATYYRHKKAMMESEYYKSLDLSKIKEEGYLDTIFFDEAF